MQFECDDCRRITSAIGCSKHNSIIYGSGMVQQSKCEHCFCKEAKSYDDQGRIIPHKQCCNCRIKKVKEQWMSNT